MAERDLLSTAFWRGFWSAFDLFPVVPAWRGRKIRVRRPASFFVSDIERLRTDELNLRIDAARARTPSRGTGRDIGRRAMRT